MTTTNSAAQPQAAPSIDSVVATQLRAKLANADLGASADAVIERAIGAPPAASGANGDAPAETSTGVFLKSIAVEGFRGIGPAATLTLDPKPGLAVVVGRNGSGKSSFAEGLELLLTGTTKRWESKTKAWSTTWQCLHHEGPTSVRAEFVAAGTADPIGLQRTWDPGANYEDAGDAAAADLALTQHGWTSAISSFRPFLSYGELASMFDKLNSLYDALSPVLGLEDVDAVLRRVSDERLHLDTEAKRIKSEAVQLAAGLDGDEPRQAALAAMLGKRNPDLAAIKAHLEAHPPGLSGTELDPTLRSSAARSVPTDDAIRESSVSLSKAREREQQLATTDADRARRLASLLEDAIRARDPALKTQDCPVCGTADVLDGAWDTRVSVEVGSLRAQATDLDAAASAAKVAAGVWTGLLRQLELADDATADDALVAAANLRTQAAAAAKQLEQLDQAWRLTSEAADDWLKRAHAAAKNADTLKAAKAAEKWLKGATDELRNERFAPIADQAVANWKQLRHQSNVELKAITLRTVGRRKEASFDVRADGEDASALGVMSQGELLALSVATFLPRAGLDESPFRFAVIDDPVQSMDPAKVEGLARVLADAAKTRQVIVFTHDDRLPQAVRRLRLPATVLQVHRQSRSQVAVDRVSTPLQENLKQANVLARSERVPLAVQQRVVPVLCRAAIEAACAHKVRERAVTIGPEALDVMERELANARTLREQLSLTLLGDAARVGELRPRLIEVGGEGAPALIGQLNSAVHDGAKEVLALHRRTEDFIHALIDAP